MDLLHYALLFFGGLTAGLYASSIGGGGLIGLPLLIFSGLPTPVAIATMRLSGVLLETASIATFYHKGKMTMPIMRLGLILGATSSIGAIIGAVLLVNMPIETLSKILGALLLGMLVTMAVSTKRKKRVGALNNKSLFWTAVASGILGIYGGFLGPGFGTIILMLLLQIGISISEASPMSRIVGLLMSLGSGILFYQNGLIDIPAGLWLGLGFAAGSWFGINYALKKGERYVKILLYIAVGVTAIKLLF
ncbi:sulfite exporter TauE/SafE family protein [Candidatus Gracilibacteria bacterium]|nr:sulfite exporter TauE/SafE family protein [Candidatus Gracilibacteria bacterium]